MIDEEEKNEMVRVFKSLLKLVEKRGIRIIRDNPEMAEEDPIAFSLVLLNECQKEYLAFAEKEKNESK